MPPQSTTVTALAAFFAGVLATLAVQNVKTYSASSIPPAGSAATMPHTEGRIIYPSSIEWTGVSHDASIKKQVLIRNGEVPRLTGVSRARFAPGQLSPAHAHRDMHEVFVVKSGVATFTIDGKEEKIKEGTVISLSPGQRHEIKNGPSDPPLELLYFGLELTG